MSKNKVSGKAPLRLTFAGGGTDLNYIFEKYGGKVVNATIDKFCHMQIYKRKDKKVFVNRVELTEKLNPLIWDTIDFLNFRQGIDIFYYNDIPPGTGLGNSSGFVALLVTLLSEFRNIKYDDRQLVEVVFHIENKRGLTGWQDQFATVMGGFNYMEFNKNYKLVYPLRIKYRLQCKLEEHLLLCFVGGERNSGDIQTQQKEKFEPTPENIKKIYRIQELVDEIKEGLLTEDISKLGKQLDETWQLKRNKINSNKTIEDFYTTGLLNGAKGGKLIGAGQSGYILFFVEPEDRAILTNVLVNAGCKIENFNFTNQGVETW